VDRQEVEKLTARQQSLFATWQVDATEDALKWAVRDRWLQPYRWRSIYRIAGANPTLYMPLMGACLAGGPRVAAGGLGAAWLYGAPDVAPALELLAFGDRARLPGVRCRQTQLDAGELLTVRHGIPVVIAPFCVVQLAGPWPLLVPAVANNLVARGLTTFRGIVECLDEFAPRGPGSTALRTFCLRELEVRGHDDSPAARALGRALNSAGLGGYETQLKVEDKEGLLFIDFAYTPMKVGIEYLGRKDHGTTVNQMERDARRRARLAALGWVILDATGGMSHTEVIRWTAATLAIRQKPAS
jgi:very-short-patch-repair endonuclease